MTKKLSQQQRFFVALIYVVLITVIFVSFGGTLGEIVDDTSDIGIWFCSGALLIIFGIYITEPFFNRPVDTITNSITVLLALLAFPNKNRLIGYRLIFIITLLLLILSLITVFFKDSKAKIIKFIHFVVMSVGNARFIFSPIYLAAAYSFFGLNQKHTEFVLIVLLWICLCVFDPVAWAFSRITSLRKFTSNDNSFIGYATQCSASEIYTVKQNYENSASIKAGNVVAIRLSKNSYKLGVVSWIQDLLSDRFIEIQCFDFGFTQNLFHPSRLGIIESNHSIRDKGDSEVISIDLNNLNNIIKQLVETHPLYLNICNFIGRVLAGSNIEVIKFSINNPMVAISEGQIVFTQIHNETVLYQIINGITAEEVLDHNNKSTYLCGFARKLGKYHNYQLETVKWVPSAAHPVFLLESSTVSDSELKDIAETSVGRLPETTKRLPIFDLDGLITHNTAILGVLGVGKSCLAFELIQKVAKADKKIICIDITNQYCSPNGLRKYLSNDDLLDDLSANTIEELKSSYKTEGKQNLQSTWGNVALYECQIKSSILSFFDSPKHVFVLNPDKHFVGKAASAYTIQGTVELSPAEKTRIISEQLLEIMENKGQSINAKCLLVYEEAHSLIPEWNSVANEGDKAAVNGTARVIMQGRKFGLGCFVITQRTANVTKSILNQCNTVFALRIYDDTGKTFLENYIGNYYSSILSTLEERHALVIGRGLALKQPVIIQLNDMNYLTIEPNPSDFEF
jgi:uncharacterized protein